MEGHVHTMSSLFAQLGEPGDEAAIALFMASHRPLAGSVQLHEAAFWSPSQAAFLRQAILDDADWADVAEALNAQLHATEWAADGPARAALAARMTCGQWPSNSCRITPVAIATST